MNTPILVYAPDREFTLPYIRREIPGKDEITDTLGKRPAVAVMLSSTEIYQSGEGWLDEDALVDPSSRWVELEEKFTAQAAGAGTKAYILRCAPIVGTGMTGPVRSLAESIYRGAFFHFPGNDARKSIVHATDVARAVKFIAENNLDPGIYNLTDGVDPSVHDIAEALAHRMSDKRISTLSTKPQQWFGRLVYGKKQYATYTESALYSSAKLQSCGFKPTDTCSYMRTHVYDNSSL